MALDSGFSADAVGTDAFDIEVQTEEQPSARTGGGGSKSKRKSVKPRYMWQYDEPTAPMAVVPEVITEPVIHAPHLTRVLEKQTNREKEIALVLALV